jgi:hypothetical protein
LEWSGPKRFIGYYLTSRQMKKYDKFNLIPESSYRDGTYRTFAERRHMKCPEPKFLELTYKTRLRMKYLEGSN